MNKLGLTISALMALTLAACQGDDGDDTGEEEVFRCDPELEGTICTVAGNGENGYDADADNTDLVAVEARLSLPQDTLTAPDG
ncbi:MAG TPA: hypothetical protein VFD53_08895, partial [Ilumatobacter sp.]|nr:hypothetical protein [Ilumatobacter sp.]